MSEDIYLTREFFHKLHDEFEQLKKDSLKIAKEIEAARLQGDLSENAEYDAAKEAQALNAARRADLEDKLARVKIIEDQNIPGDKIYIGAIVDLKDLDTDEEMTYMLVSPEESSYEDNKVSVVSPIGQALLGHGPDEEIDIKVPAGILKYKVLRVRRP
ncbi:MAG TPA: transcription elongation factor GreA [Candidatus Omnitrophota bacterium]|nr:transcription elongation factor GreA [Candidatus Omnitrophota bacterium]